MMVIRGLGVSLLWILAGVVGLVGAILSVTVILAPVGIPLLLLAKRLFKYSMVVLTPNKVRHPIKHAEKSAGDSSRRLFKRSQSMAKKGKGYTRKARKSLA
jgi:hypothetical protein